MVTGFAARSLLIERRPTAAPVPAIVLSALLAMALSACGGGGGSSEGGHPTGTTPPNLPAPNDSPNDSPDNPPDDSPSDPPNDPPSDTPSDDQPGEDPADPAEEPQGDDSDEPTPAPSDVVVVPDHGRVTLTWSAVAKADSYNLYYAESPSVSPENYAAQGGTRVENVSSPHTVENLTHGATYYFVLTAFVDGEEGTPSQLAAITLPAPISNTATYVLNDTGADRCANEDEVGLDCPQENHPRQDAESGRDADARAGRLPKTGAGAAGFDFSKISGDGLVLSADAALGDEPSDWACTLDHVTGLLWEVRPDRPDDLRHRAHTYTWFSSDESTNGGEEGMQSGGTCSGSDCDTSAYVDAVNAARLCGFDDWRVPTADELASLVHHGRTAPSIDVDYFPDVPSGSALFWTSTPVANAASEAWSLDFAEGTLVNPPKSYAAYLRLVRAAQ